MKWRGKRRDCGTLNTHHHPAYCPKSIIHYQQYPKPHQILLEHEYHHIILTTWMDLSRINGTRFKLWPSHAPSFVSACFVVYDRMITVRKCFWKLATWSNRCWCVQCTYGVDACSFIDIRARQARRNVVFAAKLNEWIYRNVNIIFLLLWQGHYVSCKLTRQHQRGVWVRYRYNLSGFTNLWTHYVIAFTTHIGIPIHCLQMD